MMCTIWSWQTYNLLCSKKDSVKEIYDMGLQYLSHMPSNLFFSVLNMMPQSQSMNCFYCLLTMPEAFLLKICFSPVKHSRFLNKVWGGKAALIGTTRLISWSISKCTLLSDYSSWLSMSKRCQLWEASDKTPWRKYLFCLLFRWLFSHTLQILLKLAALYCPLTPSNLCVVSPQPLPIIKRKPVKTNRPVALHQVIGDWCDR